MWRRPARCAAGCRTLVGYRKIDDYTVSLTTREPTSYFPYLVVYMLFTSPTSFEKAGRDWGRVETLPAAGTGPFRLTKVLPHEMTELARFDGYWDQAHKAKVDVIRLLPIPEANSRLAALRSGQVDWIEVPPPDGIPSLKAAGFTIVTNSYPHVWPWTYIVGAPNSPFKSEKVRQALNYCIDRSGLVTLLNGTAEPSTGWLKPKDPGFGKPANLYSFDPAKGKALLREAGYSPAKPLSFKVMISASGSGQMLPLPMNEYLQDNLKQACGVNVEFDVVDWNVLFNALRLPPDSPALHGAVALNNSTPSSDVSIMARFYSAAYFSPNGFNFAHWQDDKFEAALKTIAESTDPETIENVIPYCPRTSRGQPAYALHCPRPQSACHEQDREGLRLRAVVVPGSHPRQHALTGIVAAGAVAVACGAPECFFMRSSASFT